MFCHSECPYCGGYGAVGFWCCTDGKTVILVCDECEAAWLNPTELAEGKLAFISKPPLYLLPGSEISAFGEGANWASMDEITRAGFAGSVRRQGKALDDQ